MKNRWYSAGSTCAAAHTGRARAAHMAHWAARKAPGATPQTTAATAALVKVEPVCGSAARAMPLRGRVSHGPAPRKGKPPPLLSL
eukprot:4106670-Prymnesium_polylepis.1